MIFILFFQVEYQAVNRVYSESLRELVLYLNIPTSKLQYVTKDEGYFAEYEIQLTVFDKDIRQLTGDYWRRHAGQQGDKITDSVKVRIPEGSDYYVLKIVDLHAGEIFTSTQKLIHVKYLANIYWSVENDTLDLTFTVFNEQGAIDSVAATIAESKLIIATREGTYDDSFSLDVTGLAINDYSLKLEMFSDEGKIDESIIPIKISRPFYMDEETWQRKVDQLQYIGTPSEINILRQAEVAQRESLWVSFWKNFDPTPNTVYNEKESEYYERIAYADKHFANGDRGWRSDRARIYITYGPPDEIQSYPYELDSFPYEIWIYYKNNLRFVFVDRYGFGRYTLMNPAGRGI